MSASFPPGEWMVKIFQMLSSMFSSKNSNWVRMKLYFIMLLGLGMMPVNRFPWQVSHHLQLKGKEKWAPKVPAYSPPCQIAVPLQGSWARGWAKSWHHLISEARHWWQFPMCSMAKSWPSHWSRKKQTEVNSLPQLLANSDFSCSWHGSTLRRVPRL